MSPRILTCENKWQEINLIKWGRLEKDLRRLYLNQTELESLTYWIEEESWWMRPLFSLKWLVWVNHGERYAWEGVDAEANLKRMDQITQVMKILVLFLFSGTPSPNSWCPFQKVSWSSNPRWKAQLFRFPLSTCLCSFNGICHLSAYLTILVHFFPTIP